MSHTNAPRFTLHVVSERKYVNGPRLEVHTMELRELAPWRIAKRSGRAHQIGLEYVRSLGDTKPLKLDSSGVHAVTVSDGKRALASWSRMDGLGGFTGTHSVHKAVQL